jgi:hypothetical protein
LLSLHLNLCALQWYKTCEGSARAADYGIGAPAPSQKTSKPQNLKTSKPQNLKTLAHFGDDEKDKPWHLKSKVRFSGKSPTATGPPSIEGTHRVEDMLIRYTMGGRFDPVVHQQLCVKLRPRRSTVSGIPQANSSSGWPTRQRWPDRGAHTLMSTKKTPRNTPRGSMPSVVLHCSRIELSASESFFPALKCVPCAFSIVQYDPIQSIANNIYLVG